jgi:hypothetical protein
VGIRTKGVWQDRVPDPARGGAARDLGPACGHLSANLGARHAPTP